MTNIKLKAVSRTQGNNRALKDTTITPGACQLDFEDIPVLTDAFRRMVRGLEFDVCEMALSTYVCARAHGKRFTALPIFLVRAFHHAAIACGRDTGVRGPKDLEGRKVGVSRGYTVTTGVWARSVLQHEYGVDLDKITWIRSGDEHVAEYEPPRNVLPIDPGDEMPALVASGGLAAGIGLNADSPGLRMLIPDAAEAGFRALRDHGHYPINHLIVVKDEILDANPGLAADLFDAFARSKRSYVEALRAGRVERADRRVLSRSDGVHRQGSAALWHCAQPARCSKASWSDAVLQGIIDRPVGIRELFHPETHELVG